MLYTHCFTLWNFEIVGFFLLLYHASQLKLRSTVLHLQFMVT